ncbi:homeodomain-like protein [Tanacetum coccineum]|uniref:Homeodomain-like protein n=1 Tax=Tanacetum coccineum TaxID=301880 RepID=A0ABQ4WIE1_9ASTR
MSKVLQKRGFGSLPSSTKANPRDQVKSISTTVEADSYPIRHIGSSQYTEKDLGSFTLPCFINNVCFDNALVDLGASVSVMPLSTYRNLGLGELAHTKLTIKLADKTVKYPKGIAENVLERIVLENMDAYRIKERAMLFCEPFLRAVGIKAIRFKGMITIYNGNDEVTYQMVRSNLRFKYHTNEQCNKIPPLLKVSDNDKKNGISYPYQKLKGFYKGVLNLGPDYIRDARTEEWLIYGHISVHEME